MNNPFYSWALSLVHFYTPWAIKSCGCSSTGLWPRDLTCTESPFLIIQTHQHRRPINEWHNALIGSTLERARISSYVEICIHGIISPLTAPLGGSIKTCGSMFCIPCIFSTGETRQRCFLQSMLGSHNTHISYAVAGLSKWRQFLQSW